MLSSLAVLQTMLSSSRDPHTTRAPVDVLSEPQRTLVLQALLPGSGMPPVMR
jgi:hypothetical protein